MRENGVCALCEGFLTSPLESTKESFRPTLTLERTLGMLSTGMSVFKLDTKIVFDLLTSEEGSSICFKCSAILHTGLEVTAQILLLERRLRNLGARIRTTAVTENCKNNRLLRKSPRTKATSSFSKLFPESTKVSSTNDTEAEEPDNQAIKRSDEATRSTEFQHQMEINSSRYSRRVKKNVTTPPANLPKDPRTPSPANTVQSSPPAKKSVSTLPVRKSRQIKPVHGVKHCPSCDFSVDVRTPAEAQSSEPFPRSVSESLRKRSNQKLVTHFRDTHMTSTARDNFKRISNGIKVFCCPEPNCNYTQFQYNDVVRHFMSKHIQVRTSQQSSSSSTLKPSTYSCPEKNCSFIVEVNETPRGIKIRNSQGTAKDTLAAHVFSVHDIPSHPSLKSPKPKNKESSLFVEVKIGSELRKVYRCARCDYEDVLPKDVQRSQYIVSRHAFLRHFYNDHLA